MYVELLLHVIKKTFGRYHSVVTCNQVLIQLATSKSLKEVYSFNTDFFEHCVFERY